MRITNPAPAANRCQHRTPSGRQCCSTAAEAGGSLCVRHTVALAAPNDSIDFSAELIREDGHFQEAQQINHSLIALYRLLAAGRISPRRGSVLAYVAHLILTTHKAIDYDNKTRGHRRMIDPALRPFMMTLAEAAGFGPQPATVGAEPLPATAEEFAAKVLDHSHNVTS